MSLYDTYGGPGLPADGLVCDSRGGDFYDTDAERKFPTACVTYGSASLYAEPHCELSASCITLPLEEVLPSDLLESDYSIGTIPPDDPQEDV